MGGPDYKAERDKPYFSVTNPDQTFSLDLLFHPKLPTMLSRSTMRVRRVYFFPNETHMPIC